MSSLKPCPFCGEEAEGVTGEHNFIDAKVRCTGCAVETALFDAPNGTEESNAVAAAAAWNTRVGEPPA